VAVNVIQRYSPVQKIVWTVEEQGLIPIPDTAVMIIRLRTRTLTVLVSARAISVQLVQTLIRALVMLDVNASTIAVNTVLAMATSMQSVQASLTNAIDLIESV